MGYKGGDLVFKNLEAEMARRGLSKRELSTITGIDYRTLLNNLTGKNTINVKTMLAIKKNAFPDMTLDYLFSLPDEVEKGE